MSDSRDERIASGLQAGQAAAWTALYESYFDRVWRLAARMIGPDAAAVADVVQEAFLAAARSARTFDPAKGPLWLWLAGIVRNHVASHFRQRRRDGRIGDGGDLRVAVAGLWADRLQRTDADPPARIESAESAGLLRAALAELPEDYQSMLTAAYCDQAAVEEIARLHDCSATAIRSKLARARRALRQALERPASRRAATDAPAAATGGDEAQAGAGHERE